MNVNMKCEFDGLKCLYIVQAILAVGRDSSSNSLAHFIQVSFTLFICSWQSWSISSIHQRAELFAIRMVLAQIMADRMRLVVLV